MDKSEFCFSKESATGQEKNQFWLPGASSFALGQVEIKTAR